MNYKHPKVLPKIKLPALTCVQIARKRTQVGGGALAKLREIINASRQQKVVQIALSAPPGSLPQV